MIFLMVLGYVMAAIPNSNDTTGKLSSPSGPSALPFAATFVGQMLWGWRGLTAADMQATLAVMIGIICQFFHVATGNCWELHHGMKEIASWLSLKWQTKYFNCQCAVIVCSANSLPLLLRESQQLCAELGATNCFILIILFPLAILDPNHQLDSSNIIKYPSDLESRLNLSLVIQIISLSPSRSPGWPCGRAWHHSWHIMPQQARLSCRFYDMIHGFLLYMDQYHRKLMERNFMFFVTDISRWWKNKWKIMGNQRFNHHGSHQGIARIAESHAAMGRLPAPQLPER